MIRFGYYLVCMRNWTTFTENPYGTFVGVLWHTKVCYHKRTVKLNIRWFALCNRAVLWTSHFTIQFQFILKLRLAVQ